MPNTHAKVVAADYSALLWLALLLLVKMFVIISWRCCTAAFLFCFDLLCFACGFVMWMTVFAINRWHWLASWRCNDGIVCVCCKDNNQRGALKCNVERWQCCAVMAPKGLSEAAMHARMNCANRDLLAGLLWSIWTVNKFHCKKYIFYCKKISSYIITVQTEQFFFFEIAHCNTRLI